MALGRRNWKPGEEPIRGDVFVSGLRRSPIPGGASVTAEVNIVLHSADVPLGGLSVMANVSLNQFGSEPITLEMEVALVDAGDVVNAILKNTEAILTSTEPGWVVLRGAVVQPGAKKIEDKPAQRAIEAGPKTAE